MDTKQKILVVGDVEGKFKTLFNRVQAISDKSGPFDFLFCVGNFFGDSPEAWEPYKKGILKVPIPTYVLGPNKDDHVSLYGDVNGCELCPNISYLGQRGLLTSSGLSIAYLSGTEGQFTSACRFSQKDVNDLKDIVMRSKIASSTFLGVDILLTSTWPKNVTNEDKNHPVKGVVCDSQQLAWLAANIRPRYHFSGLADIYYERPPYNNHLLENESSVHCTRFIGLGKVGNSQKQKWLYAANVTPIDKMKAMDLYQVTIDETPCPYPNPFDWRVQKGKQFFYDMNGPEEPEKKRTKREFKQQNFDQSTCWFCLGSPSVEKHLVVSVGEHVYLAMAKGGLTKYHVLILPIMHHRSYAFIEDNIRSEVKKFKSALKKFCKSINMVPIFFERNFKTSHMQMHMIPVPASLAEKVKNQFISEGNELGIELTTISDHCKLEDVVEPNKAYFYVELPKKERMFCACQKEFPLEFGRDVLAGEDILSLPHRVSWRDCVGSKAEEIEVATEFRDAFKTFDFTNDDDDDI